MFKNSNIACSYKIGRNPKQYQNTNVQNSKEKFGAVLSIGI